MHSESAESKAYRAAWARAKRNRPRKLSPWSAPERIEFLRSASKTMSIAEVAAHFGVSKSSIVQHASKNGIRFRKSMTIEVYNARRREKYRNRNPLTERTERHEAVAKFASFMSFGQIALELRMSRNSVAGICARYGIKSVHAGRLKQTPEERAAYRAEWARLARARNVANGLRYDGKNRVARNPASIKRITRAQLIAFPVIHSSPQDKRQFAIEQSSRRAEQERKMSAMDICKLFASGQIDRAEMSRRLAQPQSLRAA